MKKYIFFLCAMLLSLSAIAQNLTVRGQVISKTDDEPLIGASVTIKGVNTGAVTDIDGNYTLSGVPSNATLVFSYVGFNTQEIPVNGHTEINVMLEENSNALDEVVVVGYGVVKRSDLTSSITTVKGAAITEVQTGNAMDALQGKVSGVQIATAGGPGANPVVMIRGVTSVNGTAPLYVVDGVPLNTSNINFLSNNDIESMEVLKDASASAIYGTRASNGVIIITTKKGSAGKTSVEFAASVGFQHVDKPNIATANIYEQVFKERYSNDNRVAPWNSPYENYSASDGTDWWDTIVNDVALVQNYNLGVRGGTDKYVYSFSVGYFRNNSQFDVGYWDKLNIRLNTEYNFNQYLKVGLDIAPNVERWEDSPNLFGDAMAMDPTTPIKKEESQWDPANPMNDYQRSYNNQTWNPAARIARWDNHNTKYQVLLNPYVQITPIKQLVVRSQFGANVWFQRSDGYNYKFSLDPLEQSAVNNAYRNYSDALNWTWNNTVTYMDTFAEKHNLTAMVGFTAERYADYWANASRNDIPGNSDLLHQVGAGTGDQFSNGGTSYTSLASFLGRVMYNYDNRYYITASVRADGSSRFPKGNKYGTFPSVSVAWRLSEEAFMEATQNWLNNAKVRLGWGRVGNQAIANGAYLTTLNTGINYVFGQVPVRFPSTMLGSMGNAKLKWETVEDIDFGLDLSFLNSRLNVTFDLYQKTSHDMLYAKQSQLIAGLPTWMGAITQNIGEMRARGWELAINWTDRAGDFRYDLGLQLSGVKNKGILFTGDGPILDGGGMPESITRNEDGAYISRFYGYVTDGIFQSWEEVYAHTNEHGKLIQPDAQPGDIKFLDLDHDGALTSEDKRYIGNPYPDLTMGLNLNFWYKDFDFTANFYGTFGNDIFNLQRSRYSGNGGSNVFGDTLEKTWSINNTGAEYPRLSYTDANQNYNRVSDFFVEDGSYFRCKLLTLGYTLPKSFMKNYNLRFYVSAQNVFTLTKYTGWDPERAFYDGNVLAKGIDGTNYPSPRTFLFGIDFKF